MEWSDKLAVPGLAIKMNAGARPESVRHVFRFVESIDIVPGLLYLAQGMVSKLEQFSRGIAILRKTADPNRNRQFQFLIIERKRLAGIVDQAFTDTGNDIFIARAFDEGDEIIPTQPGYMIRTAQTALQSVAQFFQDLVTS